MKAPAGIVGIELDYKTVIAAALVGAAAVWAVKSFVIEPAAETVAEVAPKVAEAVNPVNEDNIFNKGFTAAYQAVTGSDESLGADIYDLFHGEE